jgi:hypothetical protein
MLIGYLGVYSISTSPSPILLASTLTSNFTSSEKNKFTCSKLGFI